MSSGIAASARDNLGQCNTVIAELDTLDQEVITSAKSLGSTNDQISKLLERIAGLINDIGTAGIYTDDTPYVEASKQMGREMTAALAAAIERGEVSIEDIFDENYREIAGTNPKQYMTRFTELCERLFVPIQEKYLTVLPHIQYAIANDRNGYAPTHNLKYSKPQGPDPVWNAANCRNRMIFGVRNAQKGSLGQGKKSVQGLHGEDQL